MMTRSKKLSYTAIFLAMGMVLPMLFGQIPQIGSMLLPMHIPVFLATFVVGPIYATPMAIVLPLLRSLLFGRPDMYPEAIAISLELATYAVVAGILYNALRIRSLPRVHLSMLPSIVIGKVVRGLMEALLLGLKAQPFVLKTFLSGVVLYSLPGIILQLVAVPFLMQFLYRRQWLTVSYSCPKGRVSKKDC